MIPTITEVTEAAESAFFMILKFSFNFVDVIIQGFIWKVAGEISSL